MLADNQLKIKSAVIDGGIRLLEKAFSTDDYSEEDLRYVENVLHMISTKTIWRTFDSCNNYSMPEPIRTDCEKIEYWFAQSEAKARKWDIAYIKKNFPQAEFRKITNVGHGGLAVFWPEKLVKGIKFVSSQKGGIS